MRIVINCSSLMVVISMIVMIHNAIIDKNFRDMEVNNSLGSSYDYALDKMTDMYGTMRYDETREQEYIEELMLVFCNAFKEAVNSDGTFTISLLNADIKEGVFDIVVQENYQYRYRKKEGKTVCEKAVRMR
ncbi:MAG: hypothetical protein Q4F06_03470 [Eubacteriales bacterium]|nr:hypothetical protein [Eubacteriales bacterium]